MQIVRAWSLLGAALLLAGCRAADPWAELPKPDHMGQRVAVATDAAERVCAGTLATIDAEVERIESELDFDRTAARYRVWILEPERASEMCGGESSCNDVEHGAVISADNFTVERRTALELTPLLLVREGVETHPFFVEGIARAMSWPSCPYWVIRPLMFESWIHYVDQIPDAQLIAGELVGWLLDEYGAAILFDFLSLLPPWTSVDELEVLYAGYFGSPIDVDAFEHVKTSPWPWDTHCFAPEPEPAGPRRLALRASLDCDSPRVQNDFDTPGFGFVEWTLRADGGRYQLLGQLPEGSQLEIARCLCDGHWEPFEPFSPAGEMLPYYDTYQVRWHGPLDVGLELDVELEPPCSVSEQDCPAGSKCLSPEQPCQLLVDQPIAIGEPCTSGPGDLDPCVAGARCVGEPDGDGVVDGQCLGQCSSDRDCGPTEQCATSLGVCGSACSDPIGDDCGEAELTCSWTFNRTICLPASPKTLQESCEQLCALGLWCAPGVFGSCDTDKCCVPVCEVALDGADCPAELPYCFALAAADQPFGICIGD